MMSQTENLADLISKTNYPKREKLVQGLESLAESSLEQIEVGLKEAKDDWEKLGLILDQEKGLHERFEHMALTLEQKLESEIKNAKASEIKSLELSREMERISKEKSSIDLERVAQIKKDWSELKVEDSSDLAKRYVKSEERIAARVKGEETQTKIKAFEDYIVELECLKAQAEMKLSERQNTLRRVRDGVKKLELHSGQHVSKLRDRFNTLTQELSQELGWERWSSTKRKEDLVAKAAAILDGSEPCDHYRDTLTQIQADWKAIGFTTREDDALWDKFKVSCDGIYAKVQEGFAENEERREKILERLEAIKDSSEWKKTADEIQTLQEEWKNLSDVSRKAARKQGDRYRKLCDIFFERRREHFKSARSDQKGNLKEKQLLVERVKRLHSEVNWRNSIPKVRELQEQWKKTGPVPRKQSDAIWKEFQEACSVIYDKKRSEDQERDKEFEGNLEKKQALLEKAKGLLEGNDLSAIRTQLNTIDKNWNEIGRVPRKQQREIEGAYRDVNKDFDDREKKVLEEKQKHLESVSVEKARLCFELEALLFAESWDPAGDELKSLKEQWAQLGPCSQEKELKKRYRQAVQKLEKPFSDGLQGQVRAEAKKNSAMLETLVLKLEQLAGINNEKATAAAMRQMMVAELQAKMGRGAGFKNRKDESASLLKDIQLVGLVSPDEMSAFKARIEVAVAKIS
jgi:hypothetical protein